jgi:hypothetical protein
MYFSEPKRVRQRQDMKLCHRHKMMVITVDQNLGDTIGRPYDANIVAATSGVVENPEKKARYTGL